jgi:SAM-dependent methyltransferase
MERIPEPDLMNDGSQALAYAEADFAEPHNYCIELLRNSLPNLPDQGLALDLGCGPGDITTRFATAFSGWKADGIDGAAAMLSYGDAAVRRAGLSDRIQLIEAYLPEGDAPHEAYDLIFSNSLLHHLTDPHILWQSIHRWARPGTGIFIMDLMRPDTAEIANEFVSQYAANEPEILRRDFYNSLLAAYRIPEVQAQLQQAQLAHLSVEPVSDRHFIIWGRYDP